MPRTVTRAYPEDAFRKLAAHELHPVLARVYAARGIAAPAQLSDELAGLVPFSALKNAVNMAGLLADAIAAKKRLLIVADYDSDGATACAVGIRALEAFGAAVEYVVPNRFEYGYGLTPEIVRLAWETRRPDILITVDNGIAAVEGVEEARRLGLPVLVTDHHLPGDVLPEAACIVNPNQPGCGFPSKNLAGVGVMFYVMLALRAELRSRGAFDRAPEPNLGTLLPLVALGTVADMVKLDDNNRILVHRGLSRIRAGKSPPGIHALMELAGRNPLRAASYDLGFALGPRLNAAGRLTDMALGIECLTTDDTSRAREIAGKLDALNRERREIESGMHETAIKMLETMDFNPPEGGNGAEDIHALSLFDPQWHQGVVGILASRIKDRIHRPVIAFARGLNGEIKGSGRSIAGFHLRDALDLVTKREPRLILRFGGHAAAAGLTIAERDFARFAEAFERVARELLTPADLEQVVETDGGLDPEDMTLELARQFSRQVWGQGFPEPAFEGVFAVESQRVVGEKHLKLRLRQIPPSPPFSKGGADRAGNGEPFLPTLKKGGARGDFFEAILFRHTGPLPGRIAAVYQLAVNEYNGAESLQLMLRHWEEV